MRRHESVFFFFCVANFLRFENAVDGLITIKSDMLLTTEMGVAEALTLVDSTVTSIIQSLMKLVKKFGVINVDFNDLKTTLVNSGEIIFSNAQGTSDTVDIMIQNLLNPVYTEAPDLEDVTRVVYVITAHPSISIDTVEKIGNNIKEGIGNNARIIFGMVHEDFTEDLISVMLIGGKR